ncbi:MAG: hypothetical protein K1Y02_03910 [Candidatus Hydrogenedentes bacterium]|nr:hypothetical protein [Candidatus Hydrogenedentota bacterium]
MISLIALFIVQAASASEPSISVTVLADRNYATITNALHPGNRIGYRFHEHTPMIAGDIPANDSSSEELRKAADALQSSFTNRPGLRTKKIVLGDADWLPQTWTFYLAPAEDGIDMLWIVETADKGLNEYYAVQQCFRMGGTTNVAWRREIAETPAFSEYDLWDETQRDITSKTGLTHVVRHDSWQPLPAIRDTVGARTPLGIAMDSLITNGHVDTMPEVGPYNARMLEPTDSGLIVRTNLDKTWVCGIYWQRTTHVTDHHPADCLHSIVNIGGIPPHSKRALGGKIYWFKGSLDDLRAHFKRDFPNEPK